MHTYSFRLFCTNDFCFFCIPLVFIFAAVAISFFSSAIFFLALECVLYGVDWRRGSKKETRKTANKKKRGKMVVVIPFFLFHQQSKLKQTTKKKQHEVRIQMFPANRYFHKVFFPFFPFFRNSFCNFSWLLMAPFLNEKKKTPGANQEDDNQNIDLT